MKKLLLPISSVTILSSLVSVSCSQSNSKMNEKAKLITIKAIAKEVRDDVNLVDFTSEKYIKINGSDINTEIRIKSINPEGDKIKVFYVVRDIHTNLVSDIQSTILDMKYIQTKAKIEYKGKTLIYKKSDYYKPLNNLKGQELLNALIKLQSQKWSQHVQRGKEKGYSRYTELYDIYTKAFVDKYYEKDNTVLDIYSENPKGKDPYSFDFNNRHGKDLSGDEGKAVRGRKNQEGEMYNREHLVPQSWFAKDQDVRTDAHFVWPTDKYVNNARGNSSFGIAGKNAKVSLNGTKTSANVSEPIDEFKGDVARALMYFAITHNNKLVEGMLGDTYLGTFPFISKNYLDTYIDWNNKDIIDMFDIDRNNEIDKAYDNGLRNPFTDYPQLADLIWKNTNTPFVDYGILVGIE